MSQNRVMQCTETGEEFNVFQGTMAQCENWIEENADQYPESGFSIEPIEAFSFY